MASSSNPGAVVHIPGQAPKTIVLSTLLDLFLAFSPTSICPRVGNQACQGGTNTDTMGQKRQVSGTLHHEPGQVLYKSAKTLILHSMRSDEISMFHVPWKGAVGLNVGKHHSSTYLLDLWYLDKNYEVVWSSYIWFYACAYVFMGIQTLFMVLLHQKHGEGWTVVTAVNPVTVHHQYHTCGHPI